MKRLSWFLLYLILFIFIVAGVGYGLFHYFSSPRDGKIAIEKSQTELSNEYLDTLVVDIQKDLASIKMGVDGLSKDLDMIAATVAILSVIVVVNLILILLLCFVILSLRSRLKAKEALSKE